MATDFCIDGNYLRAEAMGDPRWEWPFRNNRDRVSTLFEQDYWQTKATFVAQELCIEHPDLKGFFLIAESEPREVLAGVMQFTRTWSRIPAQQIVPGSRFVTKPDLPGTFPQVSGNSLIVQPDENVPRWVFYTQKAVTSDSGPPGTGAYPTGGTYTLSVGGQTTGAITYNSNASAVQSALNALSWVSARGGVVVTGSYTTGFSILWNAYPTGSLNTSSLTLSFGTTMSTSINTVNRVQVSVRIDSTAGVFNGGTFTITVLGQTTAAIAYNATPATVKTALEALSNIGSGGIHSISNPGAGSWIGSTTILNDAATRIGVDFEISQSAITTSGSSLTPSGSTSAVTTGAAAGGNTGFYVNLRFTGVVLGTRILGSVAHGISASDGIVVTQGANYHTIPAGLYSVTADTITLTAASGVAFTTPTTITNVGAQSGNVYTGGTKLTRVKRVTDFYLPGITPGVDTIDDIPLPDYEGDDASLLAAIFAGDTDINYEVGETEYYRDGPIVQITRTILDASQL